MPKFIFVALFILVSSLFISIGAMSLFHLLIIPPIIYYAITYKEFSWKKFPLSAWALLLFSLMVILSLLFNQDILVVGLRNLGKVRFFIIAALSIIPFDFYFNQHLTEKNRDRVIKIFLWALLIGVALATIAGLFAFYTGFNPLKFRTMQSARNAGMFGMLLTYAHSLALLCTLLTYMALYPKKFERWISRWPIIIVLLLSITGLIATYARGAMLAFLASLIFINKKMALIILPLIMGAIVITSLINPKFVSFHIFRSSDQARVGCWRGALAAFEERPVLGYGYKNYEKHSSEIKKRYNFPPEQRPNFKAHAHNNFLEILATTGTLGFLSFMSWIIFWGIDLWRRKDTVAQMVFPFIICFVVGGFTQVTFNDSENAYLFLLVFALSQIRVLQK